MTTTVIAAFCGTGKTYVCEKTNIKAIEVEYWKYKEKGLQKEYIGDVKKHLGKVDYIFIATDPEGLRLLHDEGVDITLVYPENELRNEYLDRYVERDSPHDFIGAVMKYWNPWLYELKEQTYCRHVVLGKGQYLQDVIYDVHDGLFEMARVNDRKTFPYDVFVYGGNSYGVGRNEHGEPHFHFTDNIRQLPKVLSNLTKTWKTIG